MNKIYLTFDYELFFKKPGSLKKSIIDPTDDLLSCLRHNGFKGIFFIDILYYLQLLKYKELKKEVLLFKKQVGQIVSEGHRVEPHFHTHWLDAKYESNQWIFTSYKNYSMHSLKKEMLEDVFDIGIKTLVELAQRANNHYQVRSFRAGGWCIEPFENVMQLFKKYNLLIDSSVAYGLRSNNGIHDFDFRNIPNKQKYNISKSAREEDKNGEITEIPISTYKISLMEKIADKLIRKIKAEKFVKYGDGKGIKLSKSSRLEKVVRFLKSEYYMYSLESTSKEIVLTKIKRDISIKNLIFISHPKNLNKNSFEIISEMKHKGYKVGRCLSELM